MRNHAGSLSGLLIVLCALSGCMQGWEAAQIPKPEAPDGLALVQIPLSAAVSRESLWLSYTPLQDYVTYYEAVLREIGTNNYFTGTAREGYERLTVAALPGKRYEAMILAGVTLPGNGEKVLLASGYENNNGNGYLVERGQRNVITVRMSLHKTTVNFYEGTPPNPNSTGITNSPSDDAERRPLYVGEDTVNRRTIVEAWKQVGNLEFQHPHLIYHAQISGAHSLYAALGMNPANPASYIRGYTAQIGRYTPPNTISPEPLFTAPAPAIGFRTDIFDYDTGTFRDVVEMYAGIDEGELPGLSYNDYAVAFDMTYYAFGDPRSGSGLWHLRRGITHDLEQPAGGAVLLRFVAPTEYYVKADGDNGNDGRSPATPFKTIAHALAKMREPGNEIRTIAVIGTLDNVSEGGGTGGVFNIENMPADLGEIMITGYIENTAYGTPALHGRGENRRVLFISGADTKVRLDHITITGSTNVVGGGILVNNKARVTLTEGVSVENITKWGGGDGPAGAGVRVDNAALIMFGGRIYNNHVNEHGGNGYAGGVSLTNGSTFTMYGGTIDGNKAKWGGGVVVSSGCGFTLYGGNITGNEVYAAGNDGGWTGRGAGVLIWQGGVFVMHGGAISNNRQTQGLSGSSGGGGVYVEGRFEMYGGTISNNNYSVYGGGGVIVKDGGSFALNAAASNRIFGNTARGGWGQQVRREGTGVFTINGVNQSASVFDSSLP